MSDGYRVALENLRTIGTQNLPDARDQVRQAGRQLYAADAESRRVFGGGDGPFAEVASSWNKVCEKTRVPLSQLAENLTLAGDAIREIEKRYRDLEGQE